MPLGSPDGPCYDLTTIQEPGPLPLSDGARTDRSFEITLLKQLSGGTFARVYLAEATGGAISRLVAVKVLREQWLEMEEIVQRTQDEARMLARLRHPSIVKVEGLVAFQGQPAIVMEFVEGLDGKTLAETIWRSGHSVSPAPSGPWAGGSPAPWTPPGARCPTASTNPCGWSTGTSSPRT